MSIDMSWPVLTLILLLPGQGEAPAAANPRECIQRFAARGDAFAARDWKSLEQQSRGYVVDCQGLFGPEDIARAYVDLAVATYELDKLEESLEAAEQCAQVFSDEPYCRVYKARALLALGRLEEGHQAIQAADDRIRAASSEIRERLRKAEKSGRRELESRQATLDGASKYLQRLRRQFPKR